MSKLLQGIPYEEIEKIDNKGNGVYTIFTKEGLEKELSLDRGEAISIQQHLRHRAKIEVAASKQSDKEIKTQISARKKELSTELNIAALERNLGNWMDVKFIDPDIRGYWPTLDKVPYYRSLGYEVALPDDIENFDIHFSNSNPGGGLNPNGNISMHGHVLMKCHKRLQQAVLEHNYKKRELYNPKNTQGYMSENDLSKKMSQYGL
jgi:hypothetical protein